MNTEDQADSIQRWAAPARAVPCGFTSLCKARPSHTLTASPRSWNNTLLCTDDFNLTLMQILPFTRLGNHTWTKTLGFNFHFPSLIFSVAVNWKCSFPSNPHYTPSHLRPLWSLNTHRWGSLCTSRSLVGLLNCIQTRNYCQQQPIIQHKKLFSVTDPQSSVHHRNSAFTFWFRHL